MTSERSFRISRPLKAKVVIVGIRYVELLHSIRRDRRRRALDIVREQMLIRGVDIRTTEVDARVTMCRDSGRVLFLRSLAIVVCSVQHDRGTTELEHDPAGFVALTRIARHLKSQFVA